MTNRIRINVISHKRILFLMISVFAINVANAQNVQGIAFRDGASTIIFFDSTFIYEYRFGMYKYACSNGNYEYISKNKIVLNSVYSDLNNFPVRVTESFHHNDNVKYNLYIPDQQRKESIKFSLIIDHKDTLKVDGFKLTNGNYPNSFSVLISRDDSHIAPFNFNSFIQTETYYTMGSNSGIIDIHIPISTDAFNYYVINNDTLTIRRNRLIWHMKHSQLPSWNFKRVLTRSSISDALIKRVFVNCEFLMEFK